VNNGFWLFGGEGYDASAASEGNMNDLWTFRIACNPDSIVVNPTASICSGASVSLTAVGGASSGTVNWFDALNSSTAVATGSTYILSSATVSAPTVYSFYAEISSCPLPRTVVHITVNPLPEVSISTSQATICASNSTSLFASGALNYAWSTVPAATGSFVSVSPAATTIYTLTGSNVYNCQNTDTLLIEVFPCTGISEAPEQGILRHQLYPVPNKGVFTLSLEEATSGMRFTLTNTLGQVVYTQTLEEQQTVLKTGLPAGVYFYKIELSTHQKAEGKILIE
jgi:hypothetical protein